MAAPVTEPLPGSVEWNISTASFAPPSTHRIVRGWDRAPVSAHAPRLHGKTVWKKFLSKGSEAELNDDAVQEELEKAGTGARKKFRVIGAKENIADAIWDETNISGQEDLVQLTDRSESVQNAVDDPIGAAESTPKLEQETALKPPNPSIASIEFIPRKRTNTNHVITPKKPMRQSTLHEVSRRKSLHRASLGGTSRTSRPRKSLRKSSRRSTIVNNEELNSASNTNVLANVENAGLNDSGNEVFEAQNWDGSTETFSTSRNGLRRSNRLARSSLMPSDDGSQSQSMQPEEAQSPFKFTIVVSTEGMSLNNELMPPPGLPDGLNAALLQNTMEKQDDEGASNSSVELPTAAAQESDDGSSKSDNLRPDIQETYSNDALTTEGISSGSISGNIELQHESNDGIVEPPLTMSVEIVSQQLTNDDAAHEQGPNGHSEEHSETSVDVLVDETDKPLSPDLQPEALTIQVSTELETTVEISIPGTPKSSTTEAKDIVPELATENADELEDPDLMTSDLVETISKSSPATTHYDHDDTDMLRNFLTRVKANKAAKRSSPRRKRSLPHSPLRIPLGDVDTNLSPSQTQPNNEADSSETPLTKRSRQGNPLVLEDEISEPRSCRRSGRTRLPVKSQTPPGAPSFIPVRRLGQEPDTTVTLKRNEEKELAALTRVNTRKNKAGAVPALEVLARKAEEKEDPVQRQKLLKEAFDEKVAKGKQDKDAKGRRKTVTWAEELAQFQEIKDSKSLAKKDPKGKDIAGAAPEEKKPGAVRVGVRSKVALGMAMNGTPAPKRTMRSRHQ